MISIDVYINVSESMGANIIDSILEYLAPKIKEITNGRIGIKILSNLSLIRKAKATFSIPVTLMNYKNYDGEMVAKKIIEAYSFA